MNDPDIIVQADGLSRHYALPGGWGRGKHRVRALDGVSFSLRRGHTLAVVGESGCGKSTLARVLAMLDQPTSGSLQIDGVDVTRASRADLQRLRPQVQMVFQNPATSLNPRIRIGDQLAEPLLLNRPMSAQERDEAVIAMLKKVGLQPDDARRFPHTFSGGQRQRIAIARAMMLNPAVLIADEPTTALDVSIQAQILDLFAELQAEFGTSYVFVSHNLNVVEQIADDILVMLQGKAVEQGGLEQIVQRPVHPYTQLLFSASVSQLAVPRA